MHTYVVPSTAQAKALCPDDANESSASRSMHLFVRSVLSGTDHPSPLLLLYLDSYVTAMAHW